ncbi:MAG: glycosyltransferase [Bacteroidota bacterium]
MITAVIITFNEAQNIARCLASLEGVADEIIVVDSGSTDDTAEICAQFGVNFVTRAWEGYAKTKNYGNSLARFPFILSLDADEALSEELRNSILAVKPNLEGAYRFARLTHYCDQAIRYGGWYPDEKIRLFPKEKARWEGDFVHENLALSEGQKITRLSGDLLHYSFHEPEDHQKRLVHYARLAADKMYAQGKPPTIFKQWLSPFWRWFKMYILKSGWRDGKAGWQIAMGSAKAMRLRQVFLRRRYLVGAKPFHPQRRVLMVNLSKSWGGGEKWFFTVGKALKAQGFEVAWYCYSGSELAQRLEKESLTYYSAKLRFLKLLLPGQIRLVKKHLRDFLPDTVLLNASHELKTVGWIAKQLGTEKVIFRRGVSYPLSDNRLNQWFIRNVPTHFLANSQATFEAFVEVFPFVERLSHLTLNNGIDPTPWIVDHWARVPYRIAMSARLSPEKGIDRAIEALALLRDRGQQFELYILGEGPARAEIEALIKRYDLTNQIILRGFVNDVAAELNQCGFFLFTPRFGEGTSLALIEAMLLELPCIVMDSPAMGEVVLDGIGGYVVPDGDISALANCIGRLLSDQDLRLKMGEAARARALAHFTLEKLVSDLADWLQE